MPVAIVLANGRSLRLKPDTWIPKPLLLLGGRSMLERQLDWLVWNGMEDIAVVTNSEVAKHSSPVLYEQARVHLVIKPEPEGTAGDARSCFKYLKEKEHVYVMNVDDFLDYSPMQLFTAAEEDSGICICSPRLPFGKVIVRDGLVQKFEEKPHLNLCVSAGHYVFCEKALKLFPASGDIETTVLPLLAESRKLRPLRLERKQWLTINTYKDYLDAKTKFGE